MSSAPSFSSLARGRVSFEIVAQISRAIAQGSLPLGSALPPEPQLMAQFGVGRNALREAVKILEAFGLVTIRRGAGTFVQDTCTFDLLAPLFLRLLWLSPTEETLAEAYEGVDHARQVFFPEEDPTDPSVFSQLIILTGFLFPGRFPQLAADSPVPWQEGRQTASRQIFWQLIQDLACRTLRPGDQLDTEPDLMARFSVSRNVVREAVKGLEALGILEIRRPAGTFVALHNEGFPSFVDPGVYSRILTHQGSAPFLKLKISLRDAIFYLACRHATAEQRVQFQAVSLQFAQLLQSPQGELAPCAAALDEVNDLLNQLCANPLLKQIEEVVLDISVQSRNNFLENAIRTGRQREAAESYLLDADLLLRQDLAGIPGAMDRKLDLWLSLNIV